MNNREEKVLELRKERAKLFDEKHLLLAELKTINSKIKLINNQLKPAIQSSNASTVKRIKAGMR